MSDASKEFAILEAMSNAVEEYCSYVKRSVLRPITAYDTEIELPAVGFFPGETDPAIEQTGQFEFSFVVNAEIVVTAHEDELQALLYQIQRDVTRMMVIQRDQDPPFGVDGFQDIALHGASDLATDPGGDQPTAARVARFRVSYRTTTAELLEPS